MDYSSVYELIKHIPVGKVTTYGIIARKAGIKSPRTVGWVLHKNSDPQNVPCHRVVNFRGAVAANYAFGGEAVQRKKLESEGVEFVGGRVEMNKYLFNMEDNVKAKF